MLNLGSSWAVNAADIWASVMGVVAPLAPFLLLGLSIAFIPKVFYLLKSALEERQAERYEEKYRRRGYYYMNQNQIDEYERSIRFKPWRW